MISQQVYLIVNIMMLLDGIILIVTGQLAYSISLEVVSDSNVMAWADYIGSVLSLMFLNNYLMGKNELYSVRRFPSYRVMVYALLRTVTLDFIILTTGAMLIGIRPFPRSFLVSYFFLSLISLLLIRLSLYYYLDHFARSNFNAWKILLVGSEARIKLVAHALEKQRSWGHHIVGCLIVDDKDSQERGNLRNLGGIEEIDSVLRKYEIDEVVFALPKEYPIELEKVLQKCEEMGVALKIVPGLFNPDLPQRLRGESLLGIPTLAYYSGHISASGWFYKRLVDLLGGLFGFLLLLIMYPLVALMIKVDSPGPVFFKQERMCRNGRKFYLYKFRTMVADAEAKQSELLKENEMRGPMFKVEGDPRITRVGRFLRKTSLDEFPQFINVLKGEMSLVGTRPPTPNEVKQYEDWHRRRISSKPGITGQWQVSGRNKINNFSEVVKLDLEYIDNWSFSKDLWILCKTVWVVLARKGAK
jgi:exopolysaccharide biosynthesis polyprenyl glycosylphosphotransferase